MKLFFAALALALTTAAVAQTDAMPPEQNAPAQAAPTQAPTQASTQTPTPGRATWRHGPKPAPGSGLPDNDKPMVPPSHSLNVTYAGRTTTLSVEDLLNLPQVTLHVHGIHGAEETFTGPLVADVLAKAGLVANAETHELVLHAAVVATGTDRYFVMYSAAELMPAISSGKVIVAVMKSGQPITDGGLIQLVNTADSNPARWVLGLANLNVMTMAATQ